MNLVAVSVLLSLGVVADDPPAPKLPLGKDTTYVTGPLDKDGYIDYEAALNDRLGAGITPDKNANVLLWKALGPTPEGGKRMPAEFFKRLGMEEPPKDGDYFISLGHFLQDQLKLDRSEIDAVNAQQSQTAKRPWAAKEFPRIAEWLKANEKPLAVVIEAARRPDYYNPLISHWDDEKPGSLIGVLLPGAQKCRELAVALAARSMLRVEEGKFDDAWRDLLACHRLGRLVGRGDTLIEVLLGISIDGIASNADLAYLNRADLTANQIQDRLKDLRYLPPIPPVADKIDLAERFKYLDTVELVCRQGMRPIYAIEGLPVPNEEASQPPDEAELKALAGIDWTPALRDGNRWYDRISAALRIEDRTEREKALNRIDIDHAKSDAENIMSRHLPYILLGRDPPKWKAGKVIGDVLQSLLWPFHRKVQNAHDRDEQVQRNVQIAFALAAYHADHKIYPAKLDGLAPKYLPAIPDDLFSGQPLVYHLTDKGYLFYSVGVNGRDEGGCSAADDPRVDDLPVVMPLPKLKAKE